MVHLVFFTCLSYLTFTILVTTTIYPYSKANAQSLGTIYTIAGSSTSTGYSGDGGAATSATLNNPTGITLDTSGNCE